MRKIRIVQTERYPEFHIEIDNHPNVEVDEKTLRRWQTALKSFERFQNEAKRVYEDQVEGLLK